MKKVSFAKIISNPFVILGSYIVSALSLVISLCVGNKIVTYIVSGCLGAYIIAITIYIIKVYFSINRYKRNLKEKYDIEAKKTTDDLINYTATVLDDIKNSTFCSLSKDRKDIKRDLDSLCAQLVKLFKLFLGKNAVCIKIICTDSLVNIDYDKWSTQTIARDCEEDLVERREHDDVTQRLDENTSFYEIIKKAENCWASANLVKTKHKYEKGKMSYKNPDRNYLRYYKSTIVVPIYSQSNYMANEIREYIQNSATGVAIHVLGFLCIDSKNVFDNKNSQHIFETATKIAKIIGRTLYPVFENILIHEIRKAQAH